MSGGIAVAKVAQAFGTLRHAELSVLPGQINA